MTLTNQGKFAVVLVLSLFPFVASACASGGASSVALPPSVSGTHTVMGRAMFPGGTMVLMEARLFDGETSGTVEYTQAQSRREIMLKVFMDVGCVGIFKDGTQAVVAGPVTRVDGDYDGLIGSRDWWMVHLEEGGEEGDLIWSSRVERSRALGFCQRGPDQAATLRAVDGDLSIH